MLRALHWTQFAKVFPLFSKMVSRVQTLSKLEENVKTFFSHVGGHARRPSVALLTRGLSMEFATQLTGQTKDYQYAAWSKDYDPLLSSLCQDDYTPGTTKQKTHPLEVESLRVVAVSCLGEKSGQKSADIHYCYDTKEEFYQKNRARWADVMHELVKRASQTELALLRSKQTRTGHNVREFEKYGDSCKIWDPATAKTPDQTLESEDTPPPSSLSVSSSSSSSSLRTSKDRTHTPIIPTLLSMPKYCRKTKTGVRIWYVAIDRVRSVASSLCTKQCSLNYRSN